MRSVMRVALAFALLGYTSSFAPIVPSVPNGWQNFEKDRQLTDRATACCVGTIVRAGTNNGRREESTWLILSATRETETAPSGDGGSADKNSDRRRSFDRPNGVKYRNNSNDNRGNNNGYRNKNGNSRNNWRSNSNSNNNDNRQQGQTNSFISRGPNRENSPALKLVNPMKMQRIVTVQPQKNSRDKQTTTERGGQRNQKTDTPVASTSNMDKKGRSGRSRPAGVSVGSDSGGGDIGGDDRPSASRSNNKRKRQRKEHSDSDDGNDGEGRNRRASLKIGVGKKGRAATLTSRRGSLKRRDRTAEKEAKAGRAEERRTVILPEGPISVAQLAEIIDEKPVAIIKLLMTDLGVMATMTQNLDTSTCVAIVEGFGKIIGGSDELDDDDDDEYTEEGSALDSGFVAAEDELDKLVPRAPVVTIMGHIDHGKTSTLDAIRNTHVTMGEAGGITQHIAAYQVEHNGNNITFIDTPGHAAFTDMRERGANITDIVILVIAADDGVKQQTADSIACARQAGVPLVVAINKIDKETADPTRVMTELTSYNVLTEDLGGEVLCSMISAKEKIGLDDLLDKVMLQAEIMDLKADPNRAAEGIVVEAKVEKGLGTVATTLVKKGKLSVGNIFVAGETYGRVRALISTNDGKTRFDEVGPSVPVRVVGFEDIPSAGDTLVVIEDEQTARTLAENRQRIARERSSSSYQRGLMNSVAMAFGSRKEHREMCVVIKADVQGSAEALTRALQELKLENDEALVTVKVLVSEAGEVSKSDVAIAAVTPGTTVLAFNVAASFAAMEEARANGIPIEYYDIVYDAIESVESRMQEVLSPTPDGEYTGSAIVQEVFNIGGTGNIAGSRCTDGFLRKGGNVRVMRGDKILVETTIKTLRNFKAEADSIEAGNECGIGLKDFEDFQPKDVIECYIE